MSSSLPIIQTIFFYVFAFGAVLTSALVVAYRNPLYSAIALILDFFCFAGIYGLLSAHFMAVTQVLVYGGAIMVLFIFIIMLLNLRDEELGRQKFRVQHVLALVVSFSFVGFSVMAFRPLTPRADVEQNRQAWAERDAAEPGAPVRYVQTPSAVPGLFADLEEPALEAHYKRQLAGLNNGTWDPSARKWRRTQNAPPVEVPPVLAGKNARGGPLNEPATWGTVEPISVLLVNRFVVPFELTAFLLLAAIVGAVVIAKKRL